MSFQRSIRRLKGQTANAMDQEPTWEMCASAQAHTHTHTRGQITSHLICLPNKVIALLDTSDEILGQILCSPRLCLPAVAGTPPCLAPLPLSISHPNGATTAAARQRHCLQRVLPQEPKPQEPGYIHL